MCIYSCFFFFFFFFGFLIFTFLLNLRVTYHCKYLRITNIFPCLLKLPLISYICFCYSVRLLFTCYLIFPYYFLYMCDPYLLPLNYVLFLNYISLLTYLFHADSQTSVVYEVTHSNRVSDFHDFICSLLPKVILFYFTCNFIVICYLLIAYLFIVYFRCICYYILYITY